MCPWRSAHSVKGLRGLHALHPLVFPLTAFLWSDQKAWGGLSTTLTYCGLNCSFEVRLSSPPFFLNMWTCLLVGLPTLYYATDYFDINARLLKMPPVSLISSFHPIKMFLASWLMLNALVILPSLMSSANQINILNCLGYRFRSSDRVSL